MVKTSICLHTLKSMSVILSLNLTVSLRTFSFSRQHKYLCLFFDLFYQLGIFSSLQVVWYLKKGKNFEVLPKNFYCWKRSIFHLVLTPQFNFSWKCYLLSSIYSFLRPGLWLPGATGLFLSCLQWRNNPPIVVFARKTIVAWQGTLRYPVHNND